MKKLLFLFAFLFVALRADCQDPWAKTFKVGIFAPVYLDSVFAGTTYRYNNRFPRFSLAGLEFLQGAMIALDSLQVYNGNIKATFYDTKSAQQGISYLVENHKLNDLDLVIGSVRDSDFIRLADFAHEKNIPFISATYPNDGGVTNNPFTVIVNPTLKAHCEAIFSYLVQYHGTNKIYLYKKAGVQEDRIAGYFKSINEQDGKPLLQIETVNVKEYNFDPLVKKLDSTKANIIIGGSLDETFATELITALSKPKKNLAKLIGMPNWDGYLSTKKNIYPVYFTTPYYNYKNDMYSMMVKNAYAQLYRGNPSDMVHKGFEMTYIFCDLITRFPDSFMNHLNDYATKVFSDFNFKPVFIKKKGSPDYFENKHLYFMKAVGGVFTMEF